MRDLTRDPERMKTIFVNSWLSKEVKAGVFISHDNRVTVTFMGKDDSKKLTIEQSRRVLGCIDEVSEIILQSELV